MYARGGSLEHFGLRLSLRRAVFIRFCHNLCVLKFANGKVNKKNQMQKQNVTEESVFVADSS